MINSLYRHVRTVGPACALLVASALLAVSGADAQAPTPRFVPSEVLVQFKTSAGPAARQDALARAAANPREHIRTHAMRAVGDPGVVVAVTGRAVLETVRILEDHPAVEFAEPNWIYTHQATNDPYYTNGSLWGMYGDTTSPANQYGSQAGEAWAAGNTGAKTVYVGIIDEGIQYTHPDLDANVWTNPFDPAGDGVDNDGNGYVDDLRGWDFNGNNNTIYDGTGDDHGTHVTGTIGAEGGNAIGVAGVNWNVTYISGKFLGPFGGSLANAIKAVDYFTDLKVRHGLNIVATNNSWGGGGYSQGLHDAIIRAAKANILFVAAAGNGGSDQVGDNNDSVASYPSKYDTTQGTSTETAAAYDGVIAVAAIASGGGLAGFSNYGATTVDLGAPGVGVYSTVPTDGYSSYSGTSMATPHVTGSVALYAAVTGQTSGAAIKSAILGAAVPTASLSGKTVTGGRLDVNAALGVTPPPTPLPPTAPSSLNATAFSSSRIDLSWMDNSGNEDGFKVERSATAGTGFVQIATVGANTTAYSSTGLSASTTYHYRVLAYNLGGDSAPSNEANATTQVASAAPAPPSSLGATGGKRKVSLTWIQSPESDVTQNKVYRSSTPGGPYTLIATSTSPATSFNNTGLPSGVTYYYRVTAVTPRGESGYSNEASATTR